MPQRPRGSGMPRSIHDNVGGVDAPALDENLREIERRLDEAAKFATDTPPKLELLATQVGDSLQVIALVHDVGNNWEGYVRFKKLSGPGDFDASDPTDGSWTTDAITPFVETVTLEAKHGGVIAVAAPYRTASEPSLLQWVIEVFRGDADHDAELTGHELAFDTTGYPIASLTGDEDTAKHYVTMTVGDTIAAATPADPTTGAYDGLLSARQGKLRFDGTGGVANKQAAMGKIVGYKVACANDAGVLNTLIFGPYFQRRGDSKTTKPVFHVTALRSGTTVTVTIAAADPTLALTALEFRRQNSGSSLDGGYSSGWGSTSGTLGTNTAITRAVDVTSTPGLQARLLWRATWTDELGASQYIGDEINVANLETVSKILRTGSGDFVPISEAQTWYSAGNLLSPSNAGIPGPITSILEKVIPVPRGVALTSISARSYRNTAGDVVRIFLTRCDNDIGAIVLATLDHTATPPTWETVTASLSESPSNTENYDYVLEAYLTADVDGQDVMLRWIELSYTAPSYDKTY